MGAINELVWFYFSLAWLGLACLVFSLVCCVFFALGFLFVLGMLLGPFAKRVLIALHASKLITGHKSWPAYQRQSNRAGRIHTDGEKEIESESVCV